MGKIAKKLRRPLSRLKNGAENAARELAARTFFSRVTVVTLVTIVTTMLDDKTVRTDVRLTKGNDRTINNLQLILKTRNSPTKVDILAKLASH